MGSRVALFIGGDITAHLVAQGLVRALVKEGTEFLLVYPEQVVPGNKARPGYEEFYHFERTIFHENIFKEIDASPRWRSNKSVTPEGLRRIFPQAVKLMRTADVNTPEFLRVLEREEIEIGVSLRWYQKFGNDIISYFSGRGALGRRRLVNYHPGLLPRYRGVITFIRALAAGDAVAGFTLHDIDARWDAGPVLCYSTHPLDAGLSVLRNMCAHVPSATETLVEALRRLLAGAELPPMPQDEKSSGYFTFPTLEELFELQSRGIRLVSSKDMKSILEEHFASALDIPKEPLSLTDEIVRCN